MIEVTRTCGNYPNEESFEIYEGVYSSSASPVYEQSGCYAGTFYFCMNPVEHTIVLRDRSGDGWSSGSSLVLTSGDMILYIQLCSY